MDALWVFISLWVILALVLLVVLVGLNSLPASTLAAAPSDIYTPTALLPHTPPSSTITIPSFPSLAPSERSTSSLISHQETPATTGQDSWNQAASERLHQASLAYLAPTEKEANALARRMAFAGQSAHASNMCGPLAIAILRDAEWLDVDVDLHDFWLLSFDKKPAIVAETFPPTHFDYYHFDTAVNRFDFSAFPLLPGDFVYLYAGAQGTFDHMLTVTRVDEGGRAYTVTNLNGPNGYTVQEVMLYDPGQPGTGLFYDYTDKEKNRYYGLTGYGGFDVIRRKDPPPTRSTAQRAFIEQVNTLISQTGGDWRVLVREVGKQDIYNRHARRAGPVASLSKLPVAMLFFKSLEPLGIPAAQYRAYITHYGIDGRTYAQLLQAMLATSEENATESLLRIATYNGVRPDKMLAEWGLEDTVPGLHRSSARDIAHVYELLYTGTALPPEANEIIFEYLTENRSNNDTRLGALRDLVPEGGLFFNKRASIIREMLFVGDSALIVWNQGGKQQAYILVLIAYDDSRLPTTYEKLEAAFTAFAQAFWQYAQSPAP